jgi:hypothetical protein
MLACAWRKLAASALLLFWVSESSGFLPNGGVNVKRRPVPFLLQMSSTVPDTNFNAVEVAKTGGQGAISVAQQAVDQNLSLGAPRQRPSGGHFLTKGGVQVTANVQPLEFSKSLQPGTSEAAIENLIVQLDSNRGVLLTSSYEFPGRYARWSLGFVDPPVEISGKADKCSIRALNERGKVLLPAIVKAMESLKDDGTLAEVKLFQESTPANGEPASVVQIDVTVVPPPEVGTFSEEERSRQVRCETTTYGGIFIWLYYSSCLSEVGRDVMRCDVHWYADIYSFLFIFRI